MRRRTRFTLAAAIALVITASTLLLASSLEGRHLEGSWTAAMPVLEGGKSGEGGIRKVPLRLEVTSASEEDVDARAVATPGERRCEYRTVDSFTGITEAEPGGTLVLGFRGGCEDSEGNNKLVQFILYGAIREGTLVLEALEVGDEDDNLLVTATASEPALILANESFAASRSGGA